MDRKTFALYTLITGAMVGIIADQCCFTAS